jgi:hypothetical protein
LAAFFADFFFAAFFFVAIAMTPFRLNKHTNEPRLC